METIQDIQVTLLPAQPYSNGQRVIAVDLQSRVNFSTFRLLPDFSYDSGVFSSVRIDEATGKKAIVTINENRLLSGMSNDTSIRYYAQTIGGDSLSGVITFPEMDYEISASPITFELDACCSLPDVIYIDVRDYNGGRPVNLASVGSNITNAGTVTLEDYTASDFNDDFNDDFGTDLHKRIKYVLNKTTDFWKTLAAVDQFSYTINYNGKTATNSISIRLK
ncbi:MAG: hypothetical protein JNL95_03930 [Chitinophagales bacterium]|nr:hypothetical protein [Chitinophagales bacterium]